jgi:hypothetical protein
MPVPEREPEQPQAGPRPGTEPGASASGPPAAPHPPVPSMRELLAACAAARAVSTPPAPAPVARDGRDRPPHGAAHRARDAA